MGWRENQLRMEHTSFSWSWGQMALKVLSSVSLYACRGAKASPKPDKFAKKSMKNLCGLRDERAFVRSYDSEVHFLATKNRRFHGGGEFSVPRGCNQLIRVVGGVFVLANIKALGRICRNGKSQCGCVDGDDLVVFSYNE